MDGPRRPPFSSSANALTSQLEHMTTPNTLDQTSPMQIASRTSLGSTSSKGPAQATSPPSPEVQEKGVDSFSKSESQSSRRPRRQRLVSRFQYGTLCITLFIIGWNDGSIGPLIPRMRQEYNVRGLSSHYRAETDSRVAPSPRLDTPSYPLCLFCLAS